MPTPKKPSDPALWNKIKKKIRATSEGSKAGKWSPRKAVLAQMEYKKQGGKWEGGFEKPDKKASGMEFIKKLRQK